MNEIRGKGIDRKLRSIMSAASVIAQLGNEVDLALRLADIVKKYPQLTQGTYICNTYLPAAVCRVAPVPIPLTERKMRGREMDYDGQD